MHLLIVEICFFLIFSDFSRNQYPKAGYSTNLPTSAERGICVCERRLLAGICITVKTLVRSVCSQWLGVQLFWAGTASCRRWNIPVQ